MEERIANDARFADRANVRQARMMTEEERGFRPAIDLGGRRSKHFDDALAVMAVQGESKLDWSYIESWCSKHRTLAVQAEASAVWEEDETS